MHIDEIYNKAEELGVVISIARNKKDSQRIAIHLLKPTLEELSQAINTANRDGFGLILLHNASTWP